MKVQKSEGRHRGGGVEGKAQDEDGAQTVDLGYVLAVGGAPLRSLCFCCSLSPVTDG